MIKYVSVLLFISFSLGAQAQVKSPKYHVGPKVGFNVYKSRFEFKEDENLYDQSINAGYQLGMMLDLPLKKSMFHFYGDVYYSRKGKKTKIVDTGLSNNATYHFIEAPIMLRMSFIGGSSEAGMFKWHVDIGPSLSYWLGGKGVLFADGPENAYKVMFGLPPVNSSEFDKMYISNANRMQWGLMLGAGIDYPVIKKQLVFIDFRVGLGSTNLAEFDGEANLPILGFSESLDVRYLEFMFSVAYAFEIDWIQTLKGKSTVTKKKRR